MVKKATVYLSHRYSGKSLKEIGDYFGIGESAVSQVSRRFSAVLGKDRKLRRRVEDIKKKLHLSNVYRPFFAL